MTPLDKAIVHVGLIAAVLFAFSTLSFDAIVLGSVCVYLFQKDKATHD